MAAALIPYIGFYYSQETSYFGRRIAAFYTVKSIFLLYMSISAFSLTKPHLRKGKLILTVH